MSKPVDLSDREAFVLGFDFGFFAGLRARGGLLWHDATDRTPDGEGFWVASRYHDVVAILSDALRFCSSGNAAGPGVAGAEPVAESMNTADGARHQHLRAPAEQGITAAWLRDYPEIARRRARDALDRVLSFDSVDFISEAARELGTHTLFDLLGVPEADRAQIIDWTYGCADGWSGNDGKDARDAYFRGLVAEGTVKLGTGALQAMMRAQADGRPGSYLTTPEVLAFLHLIYPAGANACASAIAGAVKAFSDAPEQYAHLLDDPGTLDSAVEEILRWTTPAMYARRMARTDVDMDGCRILAGQKVTAWLASANRDERVFANPDQFDVTRAPNPHLGLGFGPHACLGAGVVRIALRSFLEAARETVAGFELAGDVAWAADIRFHCLARLPVRLSGK